MTAISETELLEDIKLDIYKQLGIKVSVEDPLFATVLANKKAMDYFSRPIIEAVESIPSLFESSLEKIAVAVEEAEKTSEQLCAETKSNLYAVCKVELDAAHARLKENLASSVDLLLKESLAGVGDEISSLESRVKSVSANSGLKKAFLTNVILSAALVITVSISSVAVYGLYNAGAANLSDARAWRSLYDSQRQIIDTLPPSVQKQFSK